MPSIGLDTIDQITRRRLGTFDAPCPLCGPFKRSPRNQRKPRVVANKGLPATATVRRPTL
jgi:hypothetical protein